MANATHILSEVQGRWHRLPVRHKWLAGLLGGSAAVAIVFAMAFSHQQSHEWLLDGREFSSRQLTEIEVAFAKSSLNDYEVRDGRVRLPRNERHLYLTALSDVSSLPIHSRRPLQEAVEHSNPLESSRQREARLELALESELANCIRRMEGVEDATVYLDEAVVGVGLQREHRVTAIVVVQPEMSKRLNGPRIDSIRKLVAGARVHLSIQDVTVADLASGISYSGTASETTRLERTDEYALRKIEFEAQWSKKISNVLRFIPGVEVSTNVELAVGKQPADGDDHPSAGPAPLLPQRVAVSVGIPGNYFYDVWSSRQRAAGKRVADPGAIAIRTIEQEVFERVERAVTPLLPAAPFGGRTSEVVVSTFPVVLPESRPPAFLSFLNRNGLAVLALVSAGAFVFFALRGILSDIRSTPREVTSPTDLESLKDRLKVIPQDESDGVGVSPESSEPMQGAAPQTVKPTVHNELEHVVRKNPAAAAEMLKQWVEKAG